MIKKYYMAVTADEYELPLAVEEDYKILAKKFGVLPNSLLSRISLGMSGRKGYKFIRIEVDEKGGRWSD